MAVILFSFSIGYFIVCICTKKITKNKMISWATVWAVLMSVNLYAASFPKESIPESDIENSKYLEPLEDLERMTYYNKSGAGNSSLELIAVTEPTVLTLKCFNPGDDSQSQNVTLKAVYDDENGHYLESGVDLIPGEIDKQNCMYLYPDNSYEIEIITSSENIEWNVSLSFLGNTSTDTFSGTGSTVTSWFAPTSCYYKVNYYGDDNFVLYKFDFHDFDNMFAGFVPEYNAQGPFTGFISMTSGYDQYIFFAIDVPSGEWTIEPVK